jgi:ribosomal protein S18 acetylase RimI-like enzyme
VITLASQYNYRQIDSSDMDFLYQVYESTRWEELQQAPWSDEQRREFLMMQFQAQHQHYQQHYAEAEYQIIEIAEQAAGRLYLDHREDEIRIVDIALLPKYRNTGVGTQILSSILAQAKNREVPVFIHVEKNNPALALYQRLGFVTKEDVGVYWLMSWTHKN